jgi:hypothetical protein
MSSWFVDASSLWPLPEASAELFLACLSAIGDVWVDKDDAFLPDWRKGSRYVDESEVIKGGILQSFRGCNWETASPASNPVKEGKIEVNPDKIENYHRYKTVSVKGATTFIGLITCSNMVDKKMWSETLNPKILMWYDVGISKE